MRLEPSGADHGASLTLAVPSTDGVDLTVHDLGALAPPPAIGEGRPILLTHATGFHGLVWAPVARHLTGFHPWAPDLRGHGSSTTPIGRGMEWGGFADDVLAVIDALRDQGHLPGELVAAGHSKGGAALLLAEQRRPGTFAALYCYEPVVFPPDVAIGVEPRPPGTPNPLAAPNPLAEGARRRRPAFDSRQQAFDNYTSKPPFAGVDPEALWAYVDHGFVDRPGGGVELACAPEVEAEVFEMASSHEAFTHLGEVACPVTIAMGSGGDFGPAAFADQVADALPRGRLVQYPDLGHFGPLQDPARIAAGIAEAVTPPA